MNQCLTVALNEQFLRIKIWLAVLGRIYFHTHTDVFLVLNELCFQNSGSSLISVIKLAHLKGLKHYWNAHKMSAVKSTLYFPNCQSHCPWIKMHARIIFHNASKSLAITASQKASGKSENYQAICGWQGNSRYITQGKPYEVSTNVMQSLI